MDALINNTVFILPARFDKGLAAVASNSGLPILSCDASVEQLAAYRFRIQWQDQQLQLYDSFALKQKPFAVCFNEYYGQQNQQANVFKQTALAKAVGPKPQEKRMLDCTAGWGRDAFVLASIGAQVTLCEQQPVIALLVDDGLRRLALTDRTLYERMRLVRGDSLALLQKEDCGALFDVVVIDPMYPDLAYKAQVKKAAQLLRALTPEQTEEETLLRQALACGVKRVVVKRPRGASSIAGLVPHHTVDAKTVRFDVYQTGG